MTEQSSRFFPIHRWEDADGVYFIGRTVVSYSFHNMRIAGIVISLLGVFALTFPLMLQPAYADSSRVKVKGDYGQQVVISKTEDLDPVKHRIVVRGFKFDPRVGVYVGLCLGPAEGAKPTPCGGGVDLQGESGSSAWISSNPPPYARNLVTPFTKKGRFSVGITISSKIGDIDCRLVQCAIAVRADHTRSGDRSHDLIIPVNFR